MKDSSQNQQKLREEKFKINISSASFYHIVFNKQYFSQLKVTMLYIFIDNVGYLGDILVFLEFTEQANKYNFIFLNL